MNVLKEKIAGLKVVRKKMADHSIKVYYYHRASMIQLNGEYGSKEFMLHLDRLNNEQKSIDRRHLNAPSTISDLIRVYCASPDWKNLAESTKEIERYNLKAIEDMFGDMPLRAVGERGARTTFLEWRDEMSQRSPRAADSKMKRLAKVFSFGLDRELITNHPLLRLRATYSTDRSDIIWTDDLLDQFRAAASPEVNRVLTVALHTGQRRGDILNLRWSNYDGRALSLQQSKTGAHVYIPCTSELRSMLDDLDRQGKHILLSARRRPWVPSGFASAWDRAWAASGINADLHFHDLRGTAVTRLAESGCTVPEIATITGHSLQTVTKILERYLSRSQTLAESAMAKLELSMIRKRTAKEAPGKLMETEWKPGFEEEFSPENS